MKRETPVVQRLRRSNGDDAIMLFVRFEKESYVCLGINQLNYQYIFSFLIFFDF